MKSLIYLILLSLFSFSAFSQYLPDTKIYGKLNENNARIKYIRSDGSEITKLGDKWHLTKSGTGKNLLEVPKFIKKDVPYKIVYVTQKGDRFSTYDLKNWAKDKEIKQTTKGQAKINILEILKKPVQPLQNEFVLDFNLITDANVKLTITDIHGQVIIDLNEPFKSGINHFKVNKDKLLLESYIYKISAGYSHYSDVIIKD